MTDIADILVRVLVDLYASIDRVERLERKVSDRDAKIVSQNALLIDREAQLKRVLEEKAFANIKTEKQLAESMERIKVLTTQVKALPQPTQQELTE